MSIIVVKTEEEIENFLKKKERIILFFTADWCPSCSILKREVSLLFKNEKALFQKNDLTILMIDIDVFFSVSKKYNILAIPHLKIFKNNQFLENIIGFKKSSKLLEVLLKLENFLDN